VLHLSPIPDSVLNALPVLDTNQLGRVVHKHTELDGLPDLDGINVAIIGVQEDRRAYRNVGCDGAADAIRPFLYQLYKGNWDFHIADLGNLYKGEQHIDTITALKEITEELLKRNIIVITIGGSQELTFGSYRAYDNLEQTVNVVAVDARLDVGGEGRDLDHQSYVSHLVLQQPHNLYNFTNLGYQTYFNNPEEIKLIDKLFFEAVRLG
jgi:formiminoglutamase